MPDKIPFVPPAKNRASTPPRRLAAAFSRSAGYAVEPRPDRFRPRLALIKRVDLSRLSDGGLAGRAGDLAARVRAGRVGETEVVEAFALVREASRRAIGLDPFDSQIVSGLAMAEGRIAELPTGEGKTLAAVFPAFLLGLTGRGVHVLTFNDYLARRDASWMGPAYELLGLSVGCIQEGMPPEEKRAAYRRDVTYATAKEAGFDDLRDGLAYRAGDRVHRPFHAAIVDEADSILIDEARIPLVISGLAEERTWDESSLAESVQRLASGADYATDEEGRNVFLTDAGAARLEGFLGRGSLYAPDNQQLLEAVYCALHAEALLKRDVDYIVRGGRIEVVDEFTGRVAERRHWPDGLQAAVEAKEGIGRRSRGRILGSITLQDYFGLYPRLCGMTATARPAAAELKEFYGLAVTVVPPHVPSRRVDRPDAVFPDRGAKRVALAGEIRRAHELGRPVLVGTASVGESEELAADLEARGVPCRVLNARNDRLEAEIVAEAGRPGAVTISTNMAGRGTDIRLGGAGGRDRERVAALGGLYVLGTNRHESLRIDFQLRGRAGRQGDPGESRFFICPEDGLFARNGLTPLLRRAAAPGLGPGGAAAPRLGRMIDHAQRVIEGRNLDLRRSLRKYSGLSELQRRIVRERRDGVLEGAHGPRVWAASRPEAAAALRARLPGTPIDELERRAVLAALDRRTADHLARLADLRESIHLVGLGGRSPLDEFRRQATAAFLEMMAGVEDEAAAVLDALAARPGPPDPDAAGLKGPSSTWTYLVDEERLGWGLQLLQGRNIGFASAAAGVYGPLFVLALLVNRFFRRPFRRPSPPPSADSAPGPRE